MKRTWEEFQEYEIEMASKIRELDKLPSSIEVYDQMIAVYDEFLQELDECPSENWRVVMDKIMIQQLRDIS